MTTEHVIGGTGNTIDMSGVDPDTREYFVKLLEANIRFAETLEAHEAERIRRMGWWQKLTNWL